MSIHNWSFKFFWLLLIWNRNDFHWMIFYFLNSWSLRLIVNNSFRNRVGSREIFRFQQIHLFSLIDNFLLTWMIYFLSSYNRYSPLLFKTTVPWTMATHLALPKLIISFLANRNISFVGILSWMISFYFCFNYFVVRFWRFMCKINEWIGSKSIFGFDYSTILFLSYLFWQ